MTYRTINGTRRKRVPSSNIQYLVKLEGTVATFECKEGGHRIVKDYGKGPRSKRIPADSLQRFARYWGLGLQENGVRGHSYGFCQKCQNETDGV